MPLSRPARSRVVAAAWIAALVLLASTLYALPAQAAGQGIRVDLTGTIRTTAVDPVELFDGSDLPKAPLEDEYRKVLLVGERAYDLDDSITLNNIQARVVGLLTGNRIAALTVTPLGTANNARGVESLGALPTSGTTHVLTMLVNWTAPDSVTPEQAASQMYDDSNNWYRDASYSALGQTGDVTPWMKITGPTSGCYADRYPILNQAKEAAAAAGFDLAAYDNYVVYFPNCAGDAAGYAGWGTVGAPNTWLNGYMDRRVTVHEQGHNYGLWHSHSYMCSNGGLIGDCVLSDYGDPFDAMGDSRKVGHFSASQKTILGWLDGRTVDLTEGGTATLVPMADDGRTTHAAVIRREDGTDYWLEYRQPVDYDSNLPWFGTEGVIVHATGTASGSPNSGPSLLDVRPDDGISVSSATLLSGQSWTSNDGVTVSVGQVTREGASVTVRTGAPPQIQTSPSQLAFPSTAVGRSSAAQVVTISNPGSTPLAITSLAVTGADSADFALGASDCANSIPAGASCTAPIGFIPTLDGTRSAELTVRDDAPGSPHVVPLTGTSVKGLLVSTPTPLISGSTTVGQTLTVTPGSWDTGSTLTYQWKRNGGTTIAGATSASYVLTSADLGATLTASVTAAKPGYSPVTKTSAATATVTGATSVSGPTPTITGNPAVGQTLSAVPGTWTPAPVALNYQWKRDGVSIVGATTPTFILTAADAGTAVTVSVTGTKTGLASATKTSAPVTVTPGLQTLMPTPTITGSLTVGSTLTANPGTWDSGTTLTYQWKKNNGVYISGATAKTYVLRSTDVGAIVSVSVTSTKPGYSPATKSTSASGPVTAGAVITGATPTVTGTATVGQKLTANAGTWTPSPVALAYQWKRNGTAISGATAATYTLVAADSGAAITVGVTGSKSGYTAVTKTSAAVTVKAAAQTLAPTPTITGTTKVGSTLTATPGTWDAGTTLAYQWKRSGVVVSGATAKTYVLKAADAGSTLTVSVTSTKPGYTPVTKSSAATAVVTGGVLTGATPTITGTAKVGQTLTAVPGTWTPAPVALSYQWKRAGVAIPGATAATYKTVSADAGKSVTVTVTGTKAGFTTLAKTSAGKTVAK
ncbi:choice-of-anchor D domain-containing protein [Rathayibacter sp. VKM Ac-2759]|uniref:choice-of-anchor D domain-containing protein n=1 Tax=Rathayibacter sp. VKM Ac-2759 TaxID=2609252 RepID=UPI001318522F|nr:choice-of-anchor D domain-containing protein [Rathayibacter sp. VKM Ac-2759]QHC68112.1 choice-of-anchor D domain-containing protein [Rathayibacter sp. VKM Ac-2759]